MLKIDRFSNIPVYEQIINAIERDIMLGSMKENDKLPSVRELANSLEVNPNTVQKVYAELNNRGVIFTVASSGAFVSKTAKDSIKAHKYELFEKIRAISLELCLAGVDEESVIKEIKATFSSKATDNEAAIVVKSERIPKVPKAKKSAAPAKRKAPEEKAVLPEVKEEPVAPMPVRKKMGIELL